MANPLFRVICAAYLIDSINMPVLGCVRGLGLQQVSSIISIITMFMVGIPLALHYAFTLKFGISGFWLGIYNGVILQLVLNYILICRADWHKIAADSVKRMSAEKTDSISISNTDQSKTD